MILLCVYTQASENGPLPTPMDTTSLSLSDPLLPPQSATPNDSSKAASIVLPHPSPQRNVRGSFLGPKRSPLGGGVATPPRSPAVQDMEEILARSRGQTVVGGGASSVGKSPSLSARRRLSLGSDQVCVIC